MPAVAGREDPEPQPALRGLSAGDLPKQVKVKKLAKLKTLDTKPGECLSATAAPAGCAGVRAWRTLFFASPQTGGLASASSHS